MVSIEQRESLRVRAHVPVDNDGGNRDKVFWTRSESRLD